MRDTQYLNLEQATSIINDCEELLKMITSIIKSSKK